MTVRPALFAVMLAAALGLPASAFAVSHPTTTSVTVTTPSTVATASYYATPSASTASPQTFDLTWSIPTAGKSGCTVCHDDPDLVRIKSGVTVSLYVDTQILDASAHKGVPCTSCHTDFAFKTPHANVSTSGEEWRAVAKLSCKNCHTVEFGEFAAGAHSPSSAAGKPASDVGAPDSSAPGMPKPLCGDCHGGHDIPSKDDAAGQQEVRMSGMTMCGNCHVKDSQSYSDYYHGSAYKMSATDAPACWDCHRTHAILPSTDRNSSVYKDRLVDTCHLCHSDPRDGYTSYTQLVHGKQQVLDENPLYVALKDVGEVVSGAFDSLKSFFKRDS
jgi:hypothetical protein